MANSNFPINIGKRGSTNARVLNGLRSGRIPYTAGFRYWHRVRVQIGDFTAESDADQTVDLNVEYPALPFPANVVRLAGAFVRIDTGLSGGAVSDVDIELGDAGDPNGLLTATPAFTGDEGTFATPAAAEYAHRVETAFAPTLRILTTGGNVDDLDTGDLTVFIPFMPLPA